ncbi:MAG: methyltransferase [Nanoarchaeota archaeon]|nr:methyltransferase [Nanoarchaeota archaeon]
MDCFIISANTDVTKQEVKELIKKDATCLTKSCIVRDVSVTDLAVLSYHCQSALRVCLLIAEGKDIDHLSFTDLSLLKEKTFGAEHIKVLEDSLPSMDFAMEIGGQIQDLTGCAVNLSNPEIKIISCNDTKVLVGIDLIGFDMGKRPYKLMAYPGSISGAFAYCLLRLAGMTKKTSVVDPFCGSATIPIEAALFTNQISPFKFGKPLLGTSLFPKEFEPFPIKENDVSICGFDHQVKVMLTAQKNAKIAGVQDRLLISKVAIDWLDAKFEEHSTDLLVTNPPKENKRTNNKKQIEKIYDELFYQAKYVLKRKGTVGVLLHHEDMIQELAQKHGFTHKKTIDLFSGKQSYIFCLFVAP